ncbi:uncharacterized protein EI90DRAFT_3061024 [Cantharellus anzutake]|uniref:uncharacterized protein n=1 Tax=Cantharellus anzutake TaxID=1750568 RepID=UPI00190546CD|nr:uncharacterized protein EI90DRAFT_3061024 [Cantharellus anzutake]KAF8330184.1 hypothetical protein EI90DRAFT_3061024 [Cantharellus anzutake]
MVRLLLSIKAELENVTDLQPGSDSFEYFFKIQCSSCHEVHSKLVSLNRKTILDMPTTKSTKTNFLWRWWEPLLILDCRGLEFIDFDPTGTWRCNGIDSGTEFEVDIGEEEWTDYDEKAKLPVSVMRIKGKWSKA